MRECPGARGFFFCLPLVLWVLFVPFFSSGCSLFDKTEKQPVPPIVANADRLRADLEKVSLELDKAAAAAKSTTAAAERSGAATAETHEKAQALEARGKGAAPEEVQPLYLAAKRALEAAAVVIGSARGTESQLAATQAELARVREHEKKQSEQISDLEAVQTKLRDALAKANEAIGKLKDAEQKAQRAAMTRLLFYGALISAAGIGLIIGAPGAQKIGWILALAGGALCVVAIFVSVAVEWVHENEWVVLVALAAAVLLVLWKLDVLSWGFKRLVGAVEKAEPGKAKDKPAGVKSALGDASVVFTKLVDAAKKDLGLVVKKPPEPKP